MMGHGIWSQQQINRLLTCFSEEGGIEENDMNNCTTRNDGLALSMIALRRNEMKRVVKNSFAAIAALSLGTLALMFAGCGGGTGGVSSEVVSGTAAVGAPLSGQVSLKDSATPPRQKSTVIASDGSFAVDVTGMKAPFVLQATGSADGVNYKLQSFAEKAGTANINPLTNLIVATAAGDDEPADVYEKSDSDKNHRIRNNLEKTLSIILAKLEPLLKRYSADHANPITGRYIANHLDLDDMFDNVKITVSSGTLSIINKKNGAVIFSGQVSDIANGIFDGTALPPTAAVPAAPTGLSATGGAGEVTLSWDSVSNAVSYNLYYATTTGVTKAGGTKITSLSAPYPQTGLPAGTTYFYVVTAVNGAGESAASTQVSAITAATSPVPVAPSPPTGLIATGGTNQVTLSWGPVSSATSYNVYYAASSGVTKTNGTKITNTSSPAVQTGLPAGTTYYYIVTAVNNAGESADSAQASAATNSAPSPACGSCHAIPPPLGQHVFHTNQGYGCATCHGTGYSSTTVNAATHMNGIKDVSLTVWNAATRSCASYCHGSRSW